jgi:hypothetical protein
LGGSSFCCTTSGAKTCISNSCQRLCNNSLLLIRVRIKVNFRVILLSRVEVDFSRSGIGFQIIANYVVVLWSIYLFHETNWVVLLRGIRINWFNSSSSNLAIQKIIVFSISKRLRSFCNDSSNLPLNFSHLLYHPIFNAIIHNEIIKVIIPPFLFFLRVSVHQWVLVENSLTLK